MTILKANVAAALNKTQLSEGDKNRMSTYAQRTAAGYCAGCADICETAVDMDIPVSDIMRCSMYQYGYADRSTAFQLYSSLPEDVRSNLLRADYKAAERRCPQNIEIGRIIAKIDREFS